MFNDDGTIEEVHRFGIGSSLSGLKIAAKIEIPSDKRHTIILLTFVSVLLEIKAGPFDPNIPKSFATWAPE